MRTSLLFGTTRREVPADLASVNGQLLARGGYVDFTAAGIVTWLPLGLRVLRRVQDIVREEMDRIGAQEILMPALHPKECWTATGRWDTVDVLFKITSPSGRAYALGASHEEIVTPLAAKFIHSYRDLPRTVYQIQTKFRDELRAKAGVLRGREFGMKDAYSFHATREDFNAWYPRMLAAYTRVYERCGVTAIRVRASGGIFTENASDEFHVETPSGEDTLLLCASCRTGVNADGTPASSCATCGGALTQTKGIEVGNTFDLGTKYSDAVGLTFTDASGATRPVLMGCYGIGTTRLVGAIVEANHDDRGIAWPSGVAPYAVHVLALAGKGGEGDAFTDAEALVADLERAGHAVLYDDRTDVSAGEKLADADLLGIPWRVVVSERARAAGGVELQERRAPRGTVVTPDAVLQALCP